MKKNLNKQQKAFVEHYITCFNAYQSAIAAGYSESTALKESYKFVTKPHIKQAIDERLKEIGDDNPAIAKPDEVLHFLSRVMRGEITDDKLMSSSEGVSLHKTKSQTEARIKAAELLGKANQLFTDKVSVNANVQQVVFEGEDDLED